MPSSCQNLPAETDFCWPAQQEQEGADSLPAHTGVALCVTDQKTWLSHLEKERTLPFPVCTLDFFKSKNKNWYDFSRDCSGFKR